MISRTAVILPTPPNLARRLISFHRSQGSILALSKSSRGNLRTKSATIIRSRARSKTRGSVIFSPLWTSLQRIRSEAIFKKILVRLDRPWRHKYQEPTLLTLLGRSQWWRWWRRAISQLTIIRNRHASTDPASTPHATKTNRFVTLLLTSRLTRPF